MLTVLTALWIAWLMPAQDPHQTMNDRGTMVMGFDQDKTAHHFYLYEDGGAIDIAVRDASDTTDRDAIRSHLPHIAMMFGMGDLDAPMLVHDSKSVPGTAVLAKQKDKVVYRYRETAMGGRVDIVTKGADALTALHEFLAYQIREHQTGDPVTVTKRR
jgi:hypothetical protein